MATKLDECRDDHAERIGRILNDFLDREARGEAVSVGDLLRNNPAYADELQEHLSVVRGMLGAPPGSASSVSPTLDHGFSPDTFPGYRIVSEVQRGGQGVVYEAVQLSTGRSVAIKVLLGGAMASKQARQRFEREVRLAAALTHPNIVVIHDSGIAEHQYFFVMEFVRGQPLDMYRRLVRLPARDAVRLMTVVCDAVSYAHRHGVIHRDLKPSNILVDEDGVPHVLDFGLAKIVGGMIEEANAESVSITGRLMGTLAYMAPEQTRGDSSAVDTRSDVYALGVILYELLTSMPPYRTSGVDITKAMESIRQLDPPRPSRLKRELRSELDAIVLKAMAKEPDRRYQSVGELGEDLRAWLAGRPVLARSHSSFYVVRKLAARHYFHTSVIVALGAAILGFAAITFQALQHERRAAQDLVKANTQFAGFNVQLTHQVEAARAKLHEYALGWFLLEWQAGRREAARVIGDQLPRGTPAHAAARFLMDESFSVEQLRQAAPQNEALLLFLIGERYMMNGREQEAARVYREYADRHQGFWLPLVQARIEQLEADGPVARSQATTQTAK